MGFFKFLSRKQERKVDDELDVPPPPPNSMPLSSFDGDLNAPFPGDEMTSQLSFPKEASFQQQGRNQPSSMDEVNLNQNSRFQSSRDATQTPITREASRQVSPQLRPVTPQMVHTPEQMGKSLYVEVEEFKKMVQDLTQIRNDLKKTEQVMEHVILNEVSMEKDYERYRAVLNDTQRKLVFIDKTLFKGGAE